MSQSDIEKTILAALYEAWSVADDGCNLHSLREQHAWDKITFEKVIDRMEHRDLIEARGAITHEITSSGVIYAENNNLVPEDMKDKHQSARTLIVEALGAIYDEKGPRDQSHYTILARTLSIDQDLVMKETHVLNVLGYLEHPSVGFYKLSSTGLDAYEDYKRRKAIADETENNSNNNSQPSQIEQKEKLTGRVFLSYAREDFETAKRLFNDFRKSSIDVWFDRDSLLPGQNWETEIRQAIRESRFFIALLSSNSVSKRGFVQKELKHALDILDEFPESSVFIIPIRLDNCVLRSERLRKLHWVDIFNNWEEGLEQILKTIRSQSDN
jgi:hypothetical protein